MFHWPPNGSKDRPMPDYWSARRQQALKSSRDARSKEVREVHLRAAEHHRQLEQWCCEAAAK
jgi:hypothetical protein